MIRTRSNKLLLGLFIMVLMLSCVKATTLNCDTWDPLCQEHEVQDAIDELDAKDNQLERRANNALNLANRADARGKITNAYVKANEAEWLKDEATVSVYNSGSSGISTRELGRLNFNNASFYLDNGYGALENYINQTCVIKSNYDEFVTLLTDKIFMLEQRIEELENLVR